MTYSCFCLNGQKGVDVRIVAYTASSFIWALYQLLFWELYHLRLTLCDALCDLIPFVQFKKREKHPSGIITLQMNGNIIIQGMPSLFLSVKFFILLKVCSSVWNSF